MRKLQHYAAHSCELAIGHKNFLSNGEKILENSFFFIQKPFSNSQKMKIYIFIKAFELTIFLEKKINCGMKVG